MTNEMIARLFEFREELGRREMSVMKRMAQYWAETERFIRNETEALVEEIARRRALGEAVPIQLVRTWDRYRRYTEQARTQLKTYDAAVQPIIEQGIRANLQLGLDSANEALELAYSGVDAPSWSRLNVEAVEQMAGMLRSSTALGALLRRGSDLAFDGAEEALVRGLALGRGAQQVAADIADAAGFSFERSILIARTEMNRAYRFASTAQYRDSGVVTGFRRLVYKPTACFACLMMDGEYYPVGQELYDHPRGKCGLVAVTIGGYTPTWETGPEWFMKLPEEEQRRIMGAGRYELWKSGGVRDLRSMVWMKPNAQWGPAPVMRSAGWFEEHYKPFQNWIPTEFKPGLDKKHADRHGKEFGIYDTESYVNRAREFLSDKDLTFSQDVFVSPKNGDRYKIDFASGELAVGRRTGIIRTYYIPWRMVPEGAGRVEYLINYWRNLE